MSGSSKFAGMGMKVDEAARMNILHPVTRQPLRIKSNGTADPNTDDGEAAYVDLLANDSAVGRAHDRSVTDKQIRMRQRRLTAEELEADRTEKLAKLTKGWKLCTLDGTPLEVECTPANARELYTLPELAWLRDQALEFSADVGNFRPTASSA